MQKKTQRPNPAMLLESLESRILLAAPIGSVDVINRTTIKGWAHDADEKAAAINVEITINGQLNTVTANLARNDLAGYLGSRYHGFSFTMPTLGPGVTTVKVEAVDPAGGRTTLRDTTLTNPAPVGSVDVANATRIAGWTWDSDTPSTSLQIRVDVDGVQGTPVTANGVRNDLAPFLGSPNFGFDISGSFADKTVDVYAIDAPSGQAKLLYSNNVAPVGSLDVNNGLTVAGWAYDPDNPSAAVKVRIDIDGVAGTPFDANLTRNDLTSFIGSPNHGFNVTLSTLTPGTHTVAVYVLDATSTSASAKLLGQASVTNRAPTGNIEIVNATQIKGWAFEPDLGASAATVNVYVDDFLFTTLQANQVRNDLTAQLGSPNHGFTVDLSSLTAGSHSITVTVEDDRNSSQDEIVLYDDFINNQTPIGSFDLVTGTKMFGWAHDFDAGTNPIDVDVYVNGQYVGKYSANQSRPDLTAALGSANHGFAIDLPPLAFGSNTIEIYASESQGNVSTLIGAKTVQNSKPVGSFDVVNASQARGWVADLNTLGVSLNVKIYINGVPQVVGVANAVRNDLTSALGSPNYGFALNMPALSAGTYEVSLYAEDSNNATLTLIGTKELIIP